MIFPVEVTLTAGILTRLDCGQYKFFRVDSLPNASVALQGVVLKDGKKSVPFPLTLNGRFKSEILYDDLFLITDTDGDYLLRVSDTDELIEDPLDGSVQLGVIVNDAGQITLNVPQQTMPDSLNVGHVDSRGPLPIVLPNNTRLQLDVRNLGCIRLAFGGGGAGDTLTITDADQNFGHELPCYDDHGKAAPLDGIIPLDGAFEVYIIPTVGVISVNIFASVTNPAQLTLGFSPLLYVPRRDY